MTPRPRQCPACSRFSRSTTSSPSSATTCGRPRRASTRSRSPGTRVRTRRSARATIWDDLRAASEKDGVVAKSVGDVVKGLSQGDRFDAEYEMPFLAHATMEPMNCTAQVTPGGCEVWIGTQILTRVQQTAAQAAGLPRRQGDGAQSPARRRLRPPAGAGHGGERRAHRAAASTGR